MKTIEATLYTAGEPISVRVTRFPNLVVQIEIPCIGAFEQIDWNGNRRSEPGRDDRHFGNVEFPQSVRDSCLSMAKLGREEALS